MPEADDRPDPPAASDEIRRLWRQLTEQPGSESCGEFAKLFATLTDDPGRDARAVLAFLVRRMRGVAGERSRTPAPALAVLEVESPETGRPAIVQYVARYAQDDPAQWDVVAELWADVLRSPAHRRQALAALRRFLRTLREVRDEPQEDARRIGELLAGVLPADQMESLRQGLSAYPVTDHRRLARAERTSLFRRAKRNDTALPEVNAHQVLVYRTEGGYILDTGRLSGADERVVQATQVSVVDVRRDVPVVVRLNLPSQDAASFVVLVTFACTVTDAVAVVRAGVDPQQGLRQHLRAHSRIFERGLGAPLTGINDVRRQVHAEIRAYLEIRPPTLPGMTVSLAAVEVTVPEELAAREYLRRGRNYELRLALEEEQTHALDRRLQRLELTRDFESERLLVDRSALEQDRLARIEQERWAREELLRAASHERQDRVEWRVQRGGVPPSGGEAQDPEPQRVLVGRMPAQVRDGAEVSLIVHVARSAPKTPGSRTALMNWWPIPAEGSDVTIVVHAETGLTPLGPEQQVVRVLTGADSDPVRFAFRACGVDVRKVDVTAWAGGTYLAALAFEVSVTDRGPHLEPVTKTATVGDVHPEDGAVTLQVHQAGDRYTFQLHNNQCVYDPVVVAIGAGADGTLDRALTTLRRLAKDVVYTPAVAREWLRSVGVSLWDSVVPEAIREQYLKLHCRIKTFSIAAGSDLVPWELLYPMTRTHDAGFLVSQFPVTRTVFNTDRSRKVNLGGVRFVEAARAPENASAEFAAISRIVSPGTAPVVVKDLSALLELFGSGAAGLTHFACHAAYREDGSAIAMSDGEFSPMMLATVKAKEALTANRPLVFINACRSAGAVPYFSRTMGWAHQFLGAGAGAFVGTLWDVRSSSAQRFAEAFYARLVDGRTLGRAALEARTEIMDDLDPTWLAYTVYGDPNALALQW